jgi:hypothetical protein
MARPRMVAMIKGTKPPSKTLARFDIRNTNSISSTGRTASTPKGQDKSPDRIR